MKTDLLSLPVEISLQHRLNIEAESKLILTVACRLAEDYLGLPSDSYTAKVKSHALWSGKETSETCVFSTGAIHINLALHELFKYPKGKNKYYYTESTSLARQELPSAFLSTRGCLCALIAHEVAHGALFYSDAQYGQKNNVHGPEWLTLTQYLRQRLSLIFDYCSKRYAECFMLTNQDIFNFKWPLVGAYIKYHSIQLKNNGRLMSNLSVFTMFEKMINQLIRCETVEGLFMMSRYLFATDVSRIQDERW